MSYAMRRRSRPWGAAVGAMVTLAAVLAVACGDGEPAQGVPLDVSDLLRSGPDAVSDDVRGDVLADSATDTPEALDLRSDPSPDERNDDPDLDPDASDVSDPDDPDASDVSDGATDAVDDPPDDDADSAVAPSDARGDADAVTEETDLSAARCRAPTAERSDEGFGYYLNEAACAHELLDIDQPENELCGPSGGGACPSVGGFTVSVCAPFRLYDTEVESLVVSTEGYIGLDPAERGFDQVPACPLVAPTSGVGPRILALHDNLQLGAGDSGLWHRAYERCPRPSDLHPGAPSCCNVVHWRGFQRNNETLPAEFQAVLYEGGEEIVFAYLGSADSGALSSTGLIDATGERTFTVACETAGSIRSFSSMCLFPPDPCAAEAP